MGILGDLGKGLGNFIKGGGIFGMAANLIGGNRSNKFARGEANRQIALQKEFAQNGIRWRVEDAKAAGLHPLYALGASGASFSPVSVQDSVGPAIQEAGQNLSRSIAATSTRAEQIMQDLAIEQAKANIKLTDTQRMALESEEARRRQAGTIAQESQHAAFADMGQASGAAKSEQAKIYTPMPNDAGTARGPTPLWRTFTLTTSPAGQDIPIVLPGGMQGDAAEVLESLSESPVIMAIVVKENIRRFGPSWGKWFTEQYIPGGSKFNTGPNFPREYRHHTRFDFDKRWEATKRKFRQQIDEAWSYFKRRFRR